MESHNFEQNILKIETVKMPNGNKVSFCGDRGGIITSLQLQRKEILYLDQETFHNTNENVKGGIPILFPNAGPLAENILFPKLKQHGFARNMKWKTQILEDGFQEILTADTETLDVYPYNFQFVQSGKFERDGSFTLKQEIENKDKSKILPLAMGLHPYFRVPQEEKKNIKFKFEGGENIEKQIDVWVNGKAISIDNPKINNPDSVLEIEIPLLGTLVIDPSVEYQKIWVWSMPEKDFVCIEPVMRNQNGLIDNPEIIEPKRTFLAQVNFKLKE